MRSEKNRAVSDTIYEEMNGRATSEGLRRKEIREA